MEAAFTGAALPRATRVLATSRNVPRCELDVVTKNYPPYRRNKAPVIKFEGVDAFRISMERISAFTEVDADTAPLLDYSDPDVFVPSKPTPPSAISWPSGDGRSVSMRGTRGSFTQPNLKTYGPFPDFYKVRSCVRARATAATALPICAPARLLTLPPRARADAEVMRRLTAPGQQRHHAASARRLESVERVGRESS
eukprot:IDg2360t1